MMDILQVLQTIGICVGAVALVAIAVMLFVVMITFAPPPPPEVPIEELREILGTPVPRAAARKRRPKKPAAESTDVNE